MMFKEKALLIAVIIGFMICHTAYADEFNQGSFAGRNYKLLERLIMENGKNSPRYDAKHRPYVVCDWDNTSVFGDTEETLTYHMWENLSYALSVSEFQKAVSLNVPKGAAKLPDDNGNPINFEDLIEDLVDNYKYIYNHYRGFAGRDGLHEVKGSEEYKDFAAKLFVMFDALEATCGTAVADQWQGQLMTGMTSDQLMALSNRSIRKNLGDKLRKIKLSSSDKLKRRCNHVSSTTLQGLRVYPDMSNLYHALISNGIDVYIVSASPEDIIIPMACSQEYHYGIPRENVFGAKFDKVNGVLQPELSPQRAMTWGPGKVDFIREHLIALKGYPPVLICGDSDGDYNMLSEFPEMKLGLIINRLKKGNIGSLCEQSGKQHQDLEPRYILQGIDENTGTFDADEATVKFGTREKRLY